MEQHTQQLQDYIRQQYRSGLHPDEIAQQLQTVGWPPEMIQQAFLAVQAEMIPTGYVQPNAIPDLTAGQSLGGEVPAANGRKRGRIRTGWQLLKVSLTVLRGNKYLLRYFAMTWVAVIVFNIALLFLIVYGLGFLFNVLGTSELRWYILAFLCYLTIFTVVNFYAAALSANMLDIFRGNRKPYGEYVKLARSKLWNIFVYSIFTAIIGVLQSLLERVRYVGQILAWLLGTVWSLSTMFVLPIIVDTDMPTVPAIKQSIGFFKQTWGENITAKVTVNLPLALIHILLASLFSSLVWVVINTGSFALVWAFVIVYIVVMGSLAVIGSFANSLINTALYYYANYHQVPPAFSAELLNSVFIKRKRSRFGKKLPQTT